MSDIALNTALQTIYSLIEFGAPPNGTQPDDCGQYADLVQELFDEYDASFQSTTILAQSGRTTDDPHMAAITNCRSLWSNHVRLRAPHELPLIEAMHKALSGAMTRPRLDLIGIVDALQAALDFNERKALALDLVEDASALSPADMVRLADTLKNQFNIPTSWIRDWKKAVTSAAKSRKEAAVALIAAPQPEEASEEAKRSWPYLINRGSIVFCAQRADLFGGSSTIQVPVADFQAKISEEQCGEDGRKNFLIEGETTTGRPFQLTMEAEDFSDDKKLKAALTAAAGAQAPIYVGMGKHLGTAIQRLSGEIPSVKRYTRTGWADGVFLIPGRTIEKVTVQLGRKLPYSLSEDAQLELGLEALEALLLSHGPERTGPALSFLLTPPLALLAGWRNERYGFFIAGRTGSLKSSWSQCAMCIYGPGFIRDDLLVKWGQGATNNALMAMAVAAYDLPFLIDNYKPNTGDGPKAFINLIHNIVEGGEKDRLTRSSELRDSRPVFAWPIVTGEDVPDNDPASLARVLVLPFVRPNGIPEHLTKAQRLSSHLSAIGKSWIVWIETEDGQKAIKEAAERFDDVRREWGTYLQEERPDMVNALRIASNLATNELTWAIAEQHPAFGPLLQKYGETYYKGLRDVGVHMASYTAESLEAARFVEMLRDLLTTGQAVLIERGTKPGIDGDRMVGWKTDDGGAFIRTKLCRALMERHFGNDCLNKISDRTLYSQLKDAGLLVLEKGDPTLVIWEIGTAQRVMKLTARALKSFTESEEEESSGT